jgi:uncharacterized protein YdeI (YjbR/CyaY-like superfamily)
MTTAPLPTFFASPADFRDWLAQHHASEPALLVGLRKVGSGQPSMTWPEAVDEALCFGWIDGVRRRIDDTAYQIRFTPRKPGSIWSRVNVAKVEALLAASRMQAAGLAAYAARSAERTGVYAFERSEPVALAPAELQLFAADVQAWAYFEHCPPGYRRVMLHWVVSAKQAATRARRLAQLMQACAEQRRMLK